MNLYPIGYWKEWIRPVVFENVRKVLACRTPVLGCHIYHCNNCGHVELVPHSCKSRFCPTCGKHTADVWCNKVLNGLSLDGKRWLSTAPKYLMNHNGLKKRWKYQVITRLKQGHRKKKWRFPQSQSYFKKYYHFAGMLNQLWYITWYAYIGASLLDPRFSVRYIGGYTKRAVMAEYRIVAYSGKSVTFSYRDYAEGGKINILLWLLLL